MFPSIDTEAILRVFLHKPFFKSSHKLIQIQVTAMITVFFENFFFTIPFWPSDSSVCLGSCLAAESKHPLAQLHESLAKASPLTLSLSSTLPYSGLDFDEAFKLAVICRMRQKEKSPRMCLMRNIYFLPCDHYRMHLRNLPIQKSSSDNCMFLLQYL